MRNHPSFAALVPLSLLMALSIAPVSAQTAETQPSPKLTMEQSAALRCSAAFAIVANGQSLGNEDALIYPPLAERGREYMVRSSARIMDEAGMTRDQMAAALQVEAQKLWDDDLVQQVMPPCLAMLEASGI